MLMLSLSPWPSGRRPRSDPPAAPRSSAGPPPCVCVYIYIYIYIHTHIYIYTLIYLFIIIFPGTGASLSARVSPGKGRVAKDCTRGGNGEGEALLWRVHQGEKGLRKWVKS